MKRILQILILLSFSLMLNAQDATFEPGVLLFEFSEVDEKKQIGYTLSNNSTDVLEWAWNLERSSDMPEEWTIQVCDLISCWAFGAESMPETASGLNQLSAGSSTLPDANYVKIDNHGVAGTASIQMCVYQDFTFTNEVVCSSLSTSSEQVSLDEVAIFPNPTQDYFQVFSNDNIVAIELYDIIGKKVRSFNFQANASYDVSDLRKGIYVARLIDKSGSQAKSLRLSKR